MPNPAPTGNAAKPRIATAGLKTPEAIRKGIDEREEAKTKQVQTSPIPEVAQQSAFEQPVPEAFRNVTECSCPADECRVNCLDETRFKCREGNAPEEELLGQVDATDELVEALARIQCEEEGHRPDQPYCGVPRWTTYQPEGRAFIRMFNLLVQKAIAS